ncbi:cyclase [Amycolatopsis sp. WAC 01376]|uniref:SRPBCC family protein n=1 Tax=Amycolatopsis sp. WAC 01376 TaxID=2203195 RepID=UPI000F76AACB|nr:SRPBCC family protein [Amycolatopsis sp. WAC 01376]RSM57225.1 cyclase [Amycolatopsis sp. WAC 01376]
MLTKAIEVDADVTTVYNQWTRFVDLPRFVPGLDRVERRDDVHTRWTISIGGLKRTFDATIAEQRADNRISWQSRSGPPHSGAVTMHHISAHRTRITVEMTIAPKGLVESVADKLGFLDRHVQVALDRFKTFIEIRNTRT